MLLTPEQQFYAGIKPKSDSDVHTKSQSFSAIGNKAHKTLQDEIVNILVMMQRQGVRSMTASEIADQYEKIIGKYKPPSTFSDPLLKLCVAKKIAFSGERVYLGTNRMQKTYSVVAQQTRLSA